MSLFVSLRTTSPGISVRSASPTCTNPERLYNDQSIGKGSATHISLGNNFVLALWIPDYLKDRRQSGPSYRLESQKLCKSSNDQPSILLFAAASPTPSGSRTRHRWGPADKSHIKLVRGSLIDTNRRSDWLSIKGSRRKSRKDDGTYLVFDDQPELHSSRFLIDGEDLILIKIIHLSFYNTEFYGSFTLSETNVNNPRQSSAKCKCQGLSGVTLLGEPFKFNPVFLNVFWKQLKI